MAKRIKRKEAAIDLYKTAMRGPCNIGMQDTPEGYQYRLWVTTWILPRIAELNADQLTGFNQPPLITGQPYPKDAGK